MDIKYFRCKNYELSDTMKYVLENKFNMKYTDKFNDIKLFILCNYSFGEQELKKLHEKWKPKNWYIYAIPHMDKLASKRLLSYYLEKPKSYDIKDIFTLQKNSLIFKKDKIYIMKSNKQRQEGIHLLYGYEILSEGQDRRYKEILSKLVSQSEPYSIIQEFLEDPYTINGHKINIRYYTTIIIKKGKISSIYIYKDGFIYYTKKPYKYCTDKDYTITTGYIDREIYEKNPLTISDLKKYISNNNKYDIFEQKVHNKIKKTIFDVFKNITFPSDNIYFQLFGVDIEPNKTFDECYILEFNKNPDSTSKDKRDFLLKSDLFESILKKVF